MVRSILVTTLLLLLSIVSCKQGDKVCTHDKLVYTKGHLVDISALKRFPEFLDTLAKYPDLQVYEILEDEYSINMHCHISKNNLLVFWDYYEMSRGKKFEKLLHESGTKIITDTLDVSTPKVPWNEAVAIAKNELDYSSCPQYQLGYYYRFNKMNSMEYFLAWRVESNGGTPTIIMDAHTGVVYYKDDGVRY